jgi:hypothetical protein
VERERQDVLRGGHREHEVGPSVGVHVAGVDDARAQPEERAGGCAERVGLGRRQAPLTDRVVQADATGAVVAGIADRDRGRPAEERGKDRQRLPEARARLRARAWPAGDGDRRRREHGVEVGAAGRRGEAAVAEEDLGATVAVDVPRGRHHPAPGRAARTRGRVRGRAEHALVAVAEHDRHAPAVRREVHPHPGVIGTAVAIDVAERDHVRAVALLGGEDRTDREVAAHDAAGPAVEATHESAPRVLQVERAAGLAHREVGIAVAVEVAEARERVAEFRVGVEPVNRRVGRGDDAAGRAAVERHRTASRKRAGLAESADDDVGEAVGVDVAGVRHRVAEVAARLHATLEDRGRSRRKAGGRAEPDPGRAARRRPDLVARAAHDDVVVAVAVDVTGGVEGASEEVLEVGRRAREDAVGRERQATRSAVEDEHAPDVLELRGVPALHADQHVAVAVAVDVPRRGKPNPRKRPGLPARRRPRGHRRQPVRRPQVQEDPSLGAQGRRVARGGDEHVAVAVGIDVARGCDPEAEVGVGLRPGRRPRQVDERVGVAAERSRQRGLGGQRERGERETGDQDAGEDDESRRHGGPRKVSRACSKGRPGRTAPTSRARVAEGVNLATSSGHANEPGP